MKQVYEIVQIVMRFRTDCCSDRQGTQYLFTSEAYISVPSSYFKPLNGPSDPRGPKIKFAASDYSLRHNQGQILVSQRGLPVKARYVMVVDAKTEPISLAEVQVYAHVVTAGEIK